jgi:hypothetical protein
MILKKESMSNQINNMNILNEILGIKEDSLILKIKDAYNRDSEYFEGEYNEQQFKIRMNKNHPRNQARNDDTSIHNLSLINKPYHSAVSYYVKYKKVQKQVDNITDWDIALQEIKEFFYEIDDQL